MFEDPSQQERFLAALAEPRPYAPAILWTGERPDPCPFVRSRRCDWLPASIDLLEQGERPGATDGHARGEFYLLDPSSAFAASVFTGLKKARRVLDLCASPGGKSLVAWRELHPSRLLANEVIGKRIGALVSNFMRCRVDPAAIFQRDSAVWASEAEECFDLVIVDAPCSGQSLLARGKPVPGGFHPATINLNTNRQRRILANAARTVAPGGHLAYMTCTFSEKENEGNVRWFLKRHPDFAAHAVACLERHRSRHADFPCYRLWPHEGFGAGAFTVLLRREGNRENLGANLPVPIWTSPSWS